jgi:hypothetical protein
MGKVISEISMSLDGFVTGHRSLEPRAVGYQEE